MSVLIKEISLGNNYSLGSITLNAPKTLNALTLSTIQALQVALSRWQKDANIVAVFLDSSSSRAFCAGGDVKAIHNHIKNNDTDAAAQFFEQEYNLDFTIHNFPKPIIVWGEGLVMGGGMGLFSGASHRVVCENSQLAMPELRIGFFPDVGAGYFLHRLVANAGLFIGLTNAQLNQQDALLHGLADYAVNAQDKNELLDKLANTSWQDNHTINNSLCHEALRTVSKNNALDFTDNPYLKNYGFIQQLSYCSSVAQATQLLTSVNPDNEWLHHAYLRMNEMSPFASAVFFSQWQQTRHMSLAEVFAYDELLANKMAQHPDFSEGVRAMLVDKDKKPHWKHTDSSAVPENEVLAITAR